MGKFPCEKCGICCTKIGENQIYEDFDRGDGVCRFLDCTNMLCTIYVSRPIICNIDEMFDVYFKDHMSRGEYYQQNRQFCLKWQKEKEQRVDAHNVS